MYVRKYVCMCRYGYGYRYRQGFFEEFGFSASQISGTAEEKADGRCDVISSSPSSQLIGRQPRYSYSIAKEVIGQDDYDNDDETKRNFATCPKKGMGQGSLLTTLRGPKESI